MSTSLDTLGLRMIREACRKGILAALFRSCRRPLRELVMTSPMRSRELSQEHYQLIGKIVTEATFLENVIDLGLWGFMAISQERGRPLSTHVHVTGRFELMREYAERRGVGPEALEALKGLGDEIRDALTDRNEIVHARWHVVHDMPRAGFGSIQRHGAFRPDILDKTVSELRSVVDTLTSLAGRLVDWLDLYAPFPPAK